MPPLDPNIILQATAKQPQFQQTDPMERYAKLMQIQGGMGQQDLQGLQIQQARQGLDDEQAVRSAYQQSGGDPATLRALLFKGGQHKAVDALDKSQLANRLTNSTIGKNEAEIPKIQQEVLTKAIAQHRDELANVNDPQSAAQWVTQGYNDPVIGQVAKRAGTLQEIIARIPQDPAAFQQWKQQSALGATKFIELNKPTIHMQDTGGASNVVSVPGLGGAPSVLGTTQKTQTPDSVASNATSRANALMVDSRAREANNKGQYDAERGVLVDPRTGVAKPVVDAAGAPLAPKDKPLTESQGKAGGMLLRATKANDILNNMETAGEYNRGLIKQGAEHIPLVGGAAAMGVNMLPGALGGPNANQQRVEQARRDFVNAALRVESGAAISQSEFQNAEKQYFPMPGDDAATIQQKKESRQNELDALKIQAGPTKTALSIRPAAGGKAGKVGGVLTPNADGSWNYGSPNASR